MSDRFDRLRALAPILDRLPHDPNARISFEWMSGALIWSDELPSAAERERLGVDTNCMRGVFRYRTTLILGKPEEKHRASWEQAKILCPNWPGFLPERQTASPERAKFIEESQAKAIADWEELDARYRKQQAEKPAATV